MGKEIIIWLTFVMNCSQEENYHSSIAYDKTSLAKKNELSSCGDAQSGLLWLAQKIGQKSKQLSAR